MDLSLLPLVFSLILTVASRLLHPYSTDDKTSRLMVKRFSTVGDTQRGSQSYIEKRRGKREIDMTRRKRGRIKRGESNLASNQFPICSPQSGTLREVHGVSQRWEMSHNQKFTGLPEPASSMHLRTTLGMNRGNANLLAPSPHYSRVASWKLTPVLI